MATPPLNGGGSSSGGAPFNKPPPQPSLHRTPVLRVTKLKADRHRQSSPGRVREGGGSDGGGRREDREADTPPLVSEDMEEEVTKSELQTDAVLKDAQHETMNHEARLVAQYIHYSIYN